MIARSSRAAGGALLVLLNLAPARGGSDPAEDLHRVRTEIEGLERELAVMGGREQGLLGELERLGAEQRLRDAGVREVGARREAVEAAIATHDARLAELGAAQDDRRRYLAFRLRERYKAGPDSALRLWLGGEGGGGGDYWSALSYAALLNERDAQVLRSFRTDAEQERQERERLAASRAELVTLESELERARAELEQSRNRQSRALARLRDDLGQRQAALVELKQAASELGRVTGEVALDSPSPVLDVRGFRGLLDWPAEGRVMAGFGSVVHPQFRTEVPHPGLDIEAPFGADIRAVFDGEVAFAEWMRGYGLTVILDHGGGVLSVYAHASVLVVQRGGRVRRGELLGKVGDTGSLEGARLYFEVRVDGRTEDPLLWLRKRP